MSPSELRFGVRGISGRRAATWKAWTEGGRASDFYVSCRALGGEMKASFHQSGNWHVSHTKGFHDTGYDDNKPKPLTRFVDRWTRPPEIAPGVTLPLRILVPWSAATTHAIAESENIVWVPPAQDGFAVEFALVLTSPDCPVNGWPCKNSMNAELAGSFYLHSGERVWVIWTVQPFSAPAVFKGQGHFFKGRNRRHLLRGGLRSIALATHTDGSRILYDIPVECKRDV